MFEFLRLLFDTSDFRARWHCGNWSAGHGWMHIAGDLLIFSAYAAIPAAIAVFAWRRRAELVFPKLYWLFALFILSCGFVHLVEATLFWKPWYRLSGILKIVTAIASWATACALIKYVPLALALPGMAKLNHELHREISERRRAQQREAELNRDLAIRIQELETLLEMLPVGIGIALDPQCRTIRTNRAFSNILGIAPGANASLSAGPGELPHFRIFRQGREADPSELPIQRAAAEGVTIRDFEEQVLRADGKKVDLLCHAAPIFDAQRVCQGAVGVFHDITERKRSEKRFRLVVEASPNALLMAGSDGRIMLANSQAEVLLGYSRDELVGMAFQRLLPDIVLASIKGTTGSDAGGGRFPRFVREGHARRKDGTEVEIEASLSQLQTPEGAFTLASVSDITERKAAEVKLLSSLREKQVLLHEIHHRVKNNLQFIISLLRLQSAEATDTRLLNVLDETRSRVHAMALVHERLYRADDLSRLDYAAYLRELVAAVGRSMSDRMTRVCFSVQADAVGLETSAAVPVGFIVNELVSNSLKHAFPDGRHGKVDVELHGNPEAGFDLSVRDDGVGIPQEFDPAGTHSMGWRLVAMLVRQLGGTMEVTRGQGTQFAIHFSPRQNA